MKVGIRVDSSTRIGIGHLMRCLTLAGCLRSRGAEIHFICREHPGHQSALLEQRGYPTYSLPLPGHGECEGGLGEAPHAEWLGVPWQEDAAQALQVLQQQIGKIDWLIVDHYAVERRWEERLRSFGTRIMVIDDLADRLHDCDLLLDQNFYPEMDRRYRGLVAEDCRLLLGPHYAILRDEFFQLGTRIRDGHVRRILIFFGGSDPSGETMKALDALCMLNGTGIEADVVVGGANPIRNMIQSRCETMPNVHCHIQVDNMAELMSRADVALGAGGSATWERCYLGLPTVTIIVADNQTEMTAALAGQGAILNLGQATQVTAQDLAKTLVELCRSPEKVKALSDTSKALMGGCGFRGAVGVANELENISRCTRNPADEP